jgi:hypothetical protein
MAKTKKNKNRGNPSIGISKMVSSCKEIYTTTLSKEQVQEKEKGVFLYLRPAK